MKKEINQLIFDISESYFRPFGFKVKKNSGGGIEIYKEINNVKIEGGFGYRFGSNSKLEYFGFLGIRHRFTDVEEIRSKIFSKYGIEDKTFSTVRLIDEEWRQQYISLTIDCDNLVSIEQHTRKLLDRLESHVLPVAEQYLSLPYWADFYEKKKETLYEVNQADLFYNYVNDEYRLKHLIILRLCGSPLFEEAFEIRKRPTMEYFEGNPDKESSMYEGAVRFRNVLLDLKELLDATSPKYDLHDLTPPFRFEKKEVVEEAKSQIKPKVVLKGRSLEVDVNVFDITLVQKQAVDAFLENIEGHYDTVLEEIISNAEFENQDGGDFSTDCGGTLACIAEESGLIKTKPVDFEREAAEHLYPQHISMDVEHDNVVISIANNYCDFVLNAHLTLAGHVEIVAWG